MRDQRDGRRSNQVSRRSLLGGAAAAAGVAGVATGAAVVGGAATAHAVEPPAAERFRPGRPIVLRGATVVTMDDELGVLADADVLVVGTRIEAVGHALPTPPGTAVVETGGGLLTPGFVDTHRHVWQTALRGVGVEWTLAEYMERMFGRWGLAYRPEDLAAGNRMGMVEALDAGVTTVLDWSHNLRTPEHADAAVDGLLAVPARARFGIGNAFADSAGWIHGGEVDRLLDSRFPSRDQLVTPQIAYDIVPPDEELLPALRFARDRGLQWTSHGGIVGYAADETITFLADNGFLSPDITLVHGGAYGEDGYRRLADAGAFLSIAAESELNAGQGYPPSHRAREFGVRMSLSMDTVVWWSGDMFSAMRATLNADRGLAHLRAHERGEVLQSNALRSAEVLEWATMGGARALGMEAEIGSITPGKLADLVLLRTDTTVMSPLSNPVGHLVFQAGRADVDTVVVNGRVVKHRGELVGVDVAGARREVEASLEHLRAEIGDQEWEAASHG
ncbi:amidohydrolase [Actinoalloteichus sp. AHMU CJ021]|uniref:amidohydrolase family protein n=1 Tax=Actinoalloteichus TaxID=65496 RepID=UPI000CA02FDA|nr:amidohydrolase [Actinoalloteichus sp. AHMU CJ021]